MQAFRPYGSVPAADNLRSRDGKDEMRRRCRAGVAGGGGEPGVRADGFLHARDLRRALRREGHAVRRGAARELRHAHGGCLRARHADTGRVHLRTGGPGFREHGARLAGGEAGVLAGGGDHGAAEHRRPGERHLPGVRPAHAVPAGGQARDERDASRARARSPAGSVSRGERRAARPGGGADTARPVESRSRRGHSREGRPAGGGVGRRGPGDAGTH